MKGYFLSLIVLLVFLSFECFALCQDDKYIYSTRQGRMEGLRSVPTNAHDLDLVSFIVFRESLSLQNASTLKIRFYLNESDKIYITAVNLHSQGQSHYQMKPLKTSWEAGWQEFNSWPVGEVLRPLGINLNDLGIKAQKGMEQPGSGEFVPAVLYENTYPSKNEVYTAYLLPKNSMAKIKYSVIRINDGKIVIPTNELRNQPANVPFKISFSLSGQPRGKYKLLLDTTELGSTIGPDRYFIFYHY